MKAFQDSGCQTLCAAPLLSLGLSQMLKAVLNLAFCDLSAHFLFRISCLGLSSCFCFLIYVSPLFNDSCTDVSTEP